MQDLYKELIQLLEQDQALIIDDKLNKALIIDRALKLDIALIKLLLTHPNIKKLFFVDIEGILVFDKVAFQRFVNTKKFLPDSYTQYKNKIGLNTDNDHYITDSREVVLVWPHKDCVLEGGQTKEDAKRNEIFYNTTLAPDEIDVLTAPKVLTNWKRYDKDGETTPAKISKADNLIIKGNNLLALHTLKEKYRGQVKLIYIDPPYNTGNDSFGYNDSFNHSTWLTFMKNRLEVARELLSIDGVIFIQIDERELAPLKILSDEIFKNENFINQINWQRTTQRTVLGQGATPIINIVEYILCYVKNISAKDIALNKIQKIIPSNDKMYNQYNLMMKTEGIRELHKTLIHNGQEINIYKHSNFLLESIPAKLRSEEYYIENFEFIVRKDSQQKESTLEQIIMSNIENNSTLFSVERILKQGKNKGELNKAYYMNDNVVYHLKKYAGVINNKIFRKVDMNNLWLDYEISSAGIAEEGGVKLKRGKKPEELIKRIIEIGTCSEKDIVLDFHLGSGTTVAVAHKMGRKYIGLEQLDYAENDSVIRLINVIKGEQSGVSKSVNWQGGGSFIYAELMQSNQNYISQIQEAKTTQELLKIWDEMQTTAFISYKVLPENINKEIKDFESLNFEEQQSFLVEILDKNLLYVNKSEVNDARHKVSEADKEMNKNFYTM